MALFSKSKVVLWPKSKTVDVYLDRKESNYFSFDINLWTARTDSELQPLVLFFQQNHITEVQILLPDDVVLTKSFIYDSKITEIDKKEVIGLAESFVPFKIDPDSIEYNLVQLTDKTIIQSKIYEKAKLDHLNTNLGKLGLKILSLQPVSESISRLMSRYYQNEYFLLYPFETNEYTLLLAKGSSVYLTANFKGPNLDIQKIINYSNLYFSSPINKIYVPSGNSYELVATTTLDKTPYSDNQIAQENNKPSNLPLPVTALFIGSPSESPAIITPVAPQNNNSNINSNPTPPTMENKKNILPVIAVFVFTAALASVIIWFVLNRNGTTAENSEPASDITPTEAVVSETPTAAPSPTLAEVSKNIKLQVLNATEINGQAATVKAMLTKLGFKSIAVGNSKETATANSIQVKSTGADVGEYLKQKLDGQFPATVDATLPATSTYDAVLIIGTDLRGAAAPTESSTGSSETSPAEVTPTTKAAKTTPTAAAKKVTPTPTTAE